MKFFDCKYPIVEAMMNQGSSFDLAVAVRNAGAFPSLFLDHNHPVQYAHIQSQLEEFKHVTGSVNLVVPITRDLLLDRDYIKLLYNFGPSHIEIFPSDHKGNVNYGREFLNSPLVIAALKLLKIKSKIILRIYQPIDPTDATQIDAVYVKGKESAGKTGDWSVKELFLHQRKLTPEIPVIPYGGVGSPDQVQWYLSHGAIAVGVGTMFAATVESPLSTAIKQKIVNSSKNDLTYLTDTGQNCLVLGEIAKEDNWNRLTSLKQGVTGNGRVGHVYLSEAVDHIDRIQTVSETVEFLCSRINNYCSANTL